MKRTESSELKAFLESAPSHPPRWITDELAQVIREDLAPGWRRLGPKIAGLHVVSALTSLWVCPQFGVELRSGAPSIMDFLTPYGELACAAGCGVAFSAITALASLFLLTPDERRVLRSRDIPVFSLLMAGSWAALMLSSGGSHPHVGTSFSLAWCVTSVAFCVLALRLKQARDS